MSIFRIISEWVKDNFKKGGDANIDREFNQKIEDLKKDLGLSVVDPAYYIKALTHRSFIELNPSLQKSNERLEFLGDAVLDLVVSDFLFKKYKNKDEGELTKMRSGLVDKHALALAAEKMNLLSYILYNKKFIKDTDEGIKTIISDALEALIGAVYIDSGLEQTEKFICKWVIGPLLETGEYRVDKNYKGRLLEYTHSKKLESPEYVLLKEEGPQHEKKFTVQVEINSVSYGAGTGKSKKSAEQEAARQTLEMMGEE